MTMISQELITPGPFNKLSQKRFGYGSIFFQADHKLSDSYQLITEPAGMNMIPLTVLALTPFKLVKLLPITPNCLEKYPQVIRLQVDRILFS